MKKRKQNGLVLVFTLIAGILSAVAGEILLRKLSYEIPDSILMGLYFGMLSFIVGSMCLIAEYISPKINGMLWKNKYYGISLKYLLPSTFLILFIIGSSLQFIYGLNIVKGKKINDIVILMDMSGSMKETDPGNARLDATKGLVEAMNEENRISMFVFDDKVQKVQDMKEVTVEIKKGVQENIDKLKNPGGQTNIKGALAEAVTHIKETEVAQRAAMVILLSDGEDTFGLKDDFEDTVKPYEENKIPVYAIGVQKNDYSLLKQLSRRTGGNYYNVADSKDLKGIFNKIYKERDRKLLLDVRNGSFESSTVYGILRVCFMMILGACIGFAVALTFDNRYAAKSFAIGGIVGGLIAGLLLEVGFLFFPWYGELHRLMADIALALVFAIFGVWVPVDEREGKNTFNTFGNWNKNTQNRAEDTNREAFH